MLRMKSKLHGFTHAYDPAEEKHLRKLGWVAENEPFPGEKVEQGNAEQANKPTRTRKQKTEA